MQLDLISISNPLSLGDMPCSVMRLVVIICIIVLLERKVKGRPQERKGRTIGKFRELASYLFLVSLPLLGCCFML